MFQLESGTFHTFQQIPPDITVLFLTSLTEVSTDLHLLAPRVLELMKASLGPPLSGAGLFSVKSPNGSTFLVKNNQLEILETHGCFNMIVN